MQTTLLEQLKGVQDARTFLGHLKKRSNAPTIAVLDHIDKALNDAGSTIAALKIARESIVMDQVEAQGGESKKAIETAVKFFNDIPL